MTILYIPTYVTHYCAHFGRYYIGLILYSGALLILVTSSNIFCKFKILMVLGIIYIHIYKYYIINIKKLLTNVEIPEIKTVTYF